MNDTDVEEICSKLKPIFGKDIDELFFRWRFEADTERKKRIEQCILALYQKNVDSILSTSKILLPPPDSGKAFGEYELGTVMYDDRPVCKFGLREKEFLRHLGLFGITGTGKSNVVFKIIDELMQKNKKVFVFDWKKQYRDYLSYRQDADVLIFGVGNKEIPCFQFNPLIPPPGIEPHQYLEHVAQIVANSYYVGEGVISLLRKGINELYEEFGVYSGTAIEYPTFKDVLEWLNNTEKRGRAKEWQDSAIRSLEAICAGGLGQIVNVQNPTMKLSELLNRNVFLELGDLGQSQKSFIIQSLLTYLYYFAMNRGIREKLLNVIVVEEAHHILRDHSKTTIKEPITDIILKEIREFSCGVLIIDQNPSMISVPALANNYCTIGMYTKHGSDISALARAMFLSDDQKECLGKLECGFGIVKLAGRVFSPFLVHFPLMDIKKGVILDLEIALRMKKAGFETNPINSRGTPPNLRIFQDIPPERSPNLPNPESWQTKLTFPSDDDEPNQARIEGFSALSTQTKGYSGKQTENLTSFVSDKRNKIVDVKSEIPKNAGMEEKEPPAVPAGQSFFTEDKISDNHAILVDKLIKDIRQHPFDGVTSRTKRLLISPRKCNDAINILVSRGMINKIEIKDKAGHRCLLELKGNTSDSFSAEKDGGIEHRFWNFTLSQINKKNGYQVELEKHIDGDGFVDQVITKGSERIAIEIETGKSRPIETINRDLSLGFSKVYCVATNPQAFELIKRKLADSIIWKEAPVKLLLACDFR